MPAPVSDPFANLRDATVASRGRNFKHMFEQVLDVSLLSCYKSYMRSNEHSFERSSQKGTIMALAAPFPAARPITRPLARQAARPGTRSAATGRRELSADRGAVRLTRRGRIVLVLVSTGFLLLAVLLSGRITADAGTSLVDQGRATGVVVVQPGESLWQIARAIAPEVDPRETVSAIRTLNGLGDSTLVAGQSIVVPLSR